MDPTYEDLLSDYKKQRGYGAVIMDGVNRALEDISHTHVQYKNEVLVALAGFIGSLAWFAQMWPLYAVNHPKANADEDYKEHKQKSLHESSLWLAEKMKISSKKTKAILFDLSEKYIEETKRLAGEKVPA
jgi:hypothetical protein